jgi:hypothetical protein
VSFIFVSSWTFADKDGSDSIRVYPQPIVSKTRITSDLELYNIEVYSILGSKVLERSSEGELDFSNLPSGYYLIKAMSEKGELVKRVQKN